MSDKGPLSSDEEAKIRAEFAAWPRDTESRLLATLDAERAKVARLREAVRLAIALQRSTDEAARHLLERARVETSADLVGELRRVLAETGGEP